MLQLDRLEIDGFKSFHEKAELTFPGAITAVVGPNGCGKSNICDAVAWALGEQSARLLRGEKMDDVIFNGSARRHPLGMAEVTLTLRSSNGDFVETGGKISVGRRVYRDGEGEYFLNGKKVRLKDVQDILYGTGLGVRAYSIIEQGKIDQVLSSRPQDRRRLIEEAAGITKYKIRKRSAELKLEETRANLTRVNDIVAEVERACNSLKRQAARAQRYTERTTLLREKRAILARARFDKLMGEAELARAALELKRDEESSGAAELALREAAQAQTRQQALDSRSQSEQGRENLSRLTAAVEKEDATIEMARRTETEVGARRLAISRDLEELESETVVRADEAARLGKLLAECRDAFESVQKLKTSVSAERQQAGERLAARESALEKTRDELAGAAAERAAARNARYEIDLGLERTASEASRLAQAIEKTAASLSELDLGLTSAEGEEIRLRGFTSEAAQNHQTQEDLIRSAAGRVEQAENRRALLREESAGIEQRARSLEEIRDAREKIAQETDQHLRQRGIPTAGLLAEKMVPRPGWERVLDRLLAEELVALLIDSGSDMAQAVVHLAASGGGTSLLDGSWRLDTSGSESWRTALVNYDELSPAIRSALPRVRFVETGEEARAGARSHPGELFAAATGDVARGALWRPPGPATAEEGLLRLKRNLEETRRRLATLASQLSESESDLAAAREERAALDKTLPTLDAARRQAEADEAVFTARLAQLRQDRQRSSQELATLTEEDFRAAQEKLRLAARRELALAEETRVEEAEIALRSRIEELSGEIGQLRLEAAAAAERESAAREQFEGTRERLAAVEREGTALAARDETAGRKRDQWHQEAQELDRRQETSRQEAREARGRRDEGLTARENAAREFETLSAQAAERAAAAGEAEAAVARVRAAFEEVRQRRFDAEMLATRVSSELDHARQDCRKEFNSPPEELPAAALAPGELDTLEADAAEIASQVEKMGPVNVLAFEEYEEQRQRLEFLTSQRQDLEASIASLMETIRKINATSSERFAEAFHKINGYFSGLFQRLFRGGTAQMRLLDENDLLDSGIEITAQPPGKRNQSILLLSGGEKAMVAIALLMAIFKYKPSPFCILDEVDAPLDEANIDRYADLIREMSEETQFIAITHNKRTMEKANSLYGVTMEEPGCTRIVSVRFD